MGAVTTVVLTMLWPGGTIALAEGAYYGHCVLLDHLAPWGWTSSSSTRPAAARRRRPDPRRSAREPAAHDARPRRGGGHPAPVVCDATVATPLRLRPLEHGCDVVLHSATKVLAGHDDVLAGVTVTRDDELRDRCT